MKRMQTSYVTHTLSGKHLTHRVTARRLFMLVPGVFLTGVIMADTIDTTGQAPYEQCGYCHEYDGNARMPAFPRLAGQHTAYLAKQLRDFRAGRRPGRMQATAELLSDADIEVVSEYFSHQTPTPARTAAQSPADTDAARRLYFTGDAQRGISACVTCHGARDAGDSLTPLLAGQHARYIEAQLGQFRRGERRNDAAGVMRAISTALTEPEISALAAFLARLEPPAPDTASGARGDRSSQKNNNNNNNNRLGLSTGDTRTAGK
jgi:cytochrome c553